MVALPQTFNTADIPDSEYEIIPPGDYEAIITESEMKATANGDGAYIQLKIQIQSGMGGSNDAKGRVLYERLNIQNKNEQAVEIAYRTLKKICEAVGKTAIKDTVELHNKRLIIAVEVEKGKPYIKDGQQKEGRDQNRIKAYKAVGGDAPASGNAPSTPAAGSPPWARK